MYNSFYGGFDTEKFSDLWSDVDKWLADYEIYKSSIQLYGLKNEEFIKTIYYILASEFAFSHHIGSRDQFKLMLFTRVLEYAPFLERELEIQKDLLTLDIAKLQEGSKAIYNSSYNPGKSPTNTSLEELDYINQQNVTNYKKSKATAYSILLSMLDEDIVKRFVDKFRNLFIKVAYPDYPLVYVNDPDATSTEGEV